MTQPEALRLAEVSPYLEGGERGQWIIDAAAELRRLAKVEDEWAALSQDQGKLESQIDRLVAQRDALLEACKVALGIVGFGKEHDQIAAAIKAVEENT